MSVYATFVDTINKNRYLHTTMQVRKDQQGGRAVLWQQFKEAVEERIRDFSP